MKLKVIAVTGLMVLGAGCGWVAGAGDSVEAVGEGVGHAVEETGDAVGRAAHETERRAERVVD